MQIQRLFEEFHRNKKHLFIVFEKLGGSLYDFIKTNNYRGFHMETVRVFAKQIFEGVACMEVFFLCENVSLSSYELNPY